MDAWFEGLRAGRAFVSSGPLVELTVDGRSPGDTVALPDGGASVELVGRVRSITPLERVFVVCKGIEVADIPLTGDRRSADFTRSVTVDDSGWCHLRAEGSRAERTPLDVAYVQGFTNPTWITVGGRPVRNLASAEYGIRWIDTLQELADAWPGWRAEKERAHVFAQFEEAREIYRRLAREAGAR